MSSDTPRSDANLSHLPGCVAGEGTQAGPCDCREHQLVDADFARQLERDLTACRHHLQQLLTALECETVEDALMETAARNALSLEAANAIKTGCGWDANWWPSSRDRAFFLALREELEKAR